MESQPLPETLPRARQALLVWFVFILLAIILNGTIPFALGVDLRGWTFSTAKSILFSLLLYGGVFLIIPLVMLKGWQTVRQPGFLAPLVLALIAVSLWQVFRGVGALAVLALAYLHWRYDLSDLGIRSRGWKGDLAVVLLYGVLGAAPILFRPLALSLTPGKALLAGLDRLFANPASSVEYMFYLGFLAESLSRKAGKWLTPILIGLMYTAHEMTNPEYWYGGMSFAFTLVGVTFVTALYLWRKSVVAIWLGDGLRRALMALI